MITTSSKKPARGQLLPVLAAILFLSSAAGFAVDIDGTVDQGEYANQLSLAGEDFLLYWAVAGDTVHFAMQARTTGWVSLGIEPTQAMAEADMIFGWVDAGGAAGALDCYSTGLFGPHPTDEELGGQHHILAFAGNEHDGVTTFEFSRALETGDAYDKPLSTEGEIKIIWATGDSDDHLDPHTRRGSATIDLTAGRTAGGETAAAGVQVDLYGILYRVHGTLMSISFALLFVGMFFPRYLKKKKWWLKAHRRIGIGGAVIGVVGIGIATYMVSQTTGVHLRVPHSWIGLVTVILMIFTPFLGHFMLKIRKVPARAKKARAVHRWTGRIALLFMAATIVLGLLQAGII